jgi:hypothetical protein
MPGRPSMAAVTGRLVTSAPPSRTPTALQKEKMAMFPKHPSGWPGPVASQTWATSSTTSSARSRRQRRRNGQILWIASRHDHAATSSSSSGASLGRSTSPALLEPHPGAHQRHQVRTVDRPPPLLGRLQQLEHHRQPGVLAAGPLGDPGSGPHRREGRLDRIRGPEMDPMLGRIVMEGEQRLGVVDHLGDRLGPLGAEVGGERLDGPLGGGAILGLGDLVQRLAGARVDALR